MGLMRLAGIIFAANAVRPVPFAARLLADLGADVVRVEKGIKK